MCKCSYLFSLSVIQFFSSCVSSLCILFIRSPPPPHIPRYEIARIKTLSGYWLHVYSYISSEDVLYQTIQNIIDCYQISDLELLLCDSPDHGLNTNTQIFGAVHEYKGAIKTLYLNTVMYVSKPVLQCTPFFLVSIYLVLYLKSVYYLDFVVGRELK